MTALTDEEVRASFEKWAPEECLELDTNHDGSYFYGATAEAWKAWKAAKLSGGAGDPVAWEVIKAFGGESDSYSIGEVVRVHDIREGRCTAMRTSGYGTIVGVPIDRLRPLYAHPPAEPAVVPARDLTSEEQGIFNRALLDSVTVVEPLGAEFEAIWDANTDKIYESDTPKPEPVADDLVERLSPSALFELIQKHTDDHGNLPCDHIAEICRQIDALYRARITADAAVIAGKDADIARLYADQDHKPCAEIMTRQGERLVAAEARITDLQAEVGRKDDALAEIANAYTAHGYSDAADAVQALKDIARDALK